MKLFTTALIAIAFSTFAANAEEKKSSAPTVKTKSVKPVVVKAPFENHWDANTWEAKSGDNFWNAKSTPKKNQNEAPRPTR